MVSYSVEGLVWLHPHALLSAAKLVPHMRAVCNTLPCSAARCCRSFSAAVLVAFFEHSNVTTSTCRHRVAAALNSSVLAGNAEGAPVQRLMGLGFGKQECQQALQMCNGNEDQAASFLFESSMGG